MECDFGQCNVMECDFGQCNVMECDFRQCNVMECDFPSDKYSDVHELLYDYIPSSSSHIMLHLPTCFLFSIIMAHSLYNKC